jgi:hypothetical protein
MKAVLALRSFTPRQIQRAIDALKALPHDWSPADGAEVDLRTGSRIYAGQLDRTPNTAAWDAHVASLPDAVTPPNARERERVVSILTARKRTG